MFQHLKCVKNVTILIIRDKTLSVVEIVNSLQETPSPAGYRTKSNLYQHKGMMSKDVRFDEDDDDNEDDTEESQILEDIFFVKGWTSEIDDTY